MGNFSLGEAILGTGVDLKGLTSGLDRAKGTAEGAIGKIGNVFSTALGTAAGFIGANVIGGLAGQIQNVASSMISGNAEFERYETQFGVLLGSTEAAKERLADLAEFGASTPFELPEVVRADKIMQAFGLHAEDTAARFGFSGEQIRTIAGDVAAGTGAGFEEIAGYLGKFASGATGEAISRMQELGIVTRQQLSEMGLEFSNSGQLLTPVDEAMDVLLASMQTKFGGMMNAQSTTFEGMVSNLQDWVGATTRTLGAPIFEVVKEKLGGLLTFLNSPEAKAGLQSVAAGLASLIGYALQLVPPFQTAFGVLQTIDLGPLMAAFGNLLSVMGVQMPTASQTVQAVATGIVAAAQMAADFLNNVAIPAFTAVVNWVAANWPTIQATIQQVMGQIQTVIQSVLSNVQGFWQTWGGTIMGVVNELFTFWQTVFAAFSAAFSGDWEKFGELLRVAFDQAWENIKGIASAAFEWFSAQDWGAIGQSILEGIAAGIAAGAQMIQDAAMAAAKAALDAVKGFLGIHSPSDVAAEEVGMPYSQGIAEGILGGMPDIRAAAVAASALTHSDGRIFNVDARGATLTRGDIRAIIEEVLADKGRLAFARAGMR